jgi:energy-coupling factor transporter ATP-binding protein EcfA2
MTVKAIYFLTGASGSGKTTLLNGVKNKYHQKINAHHFDELEIPSNNEMYEKYGGPENWQSIQVSKWIEAVNNDKKEGLFILEGQARPKIILESAEQVGITTIHITLIDCSYEERRKRLLKERKQPELDTVDMYAWVAYLRGQADALGLEIIDTTGRELSESITDLIRSIELFAKENNLSIG